MSLADKIASSQPKWNRRPEVLLSPAIPVPMSGVSPRTCLGEEWWNETRRAAYRSTGYHCLACGVWKLDAVEKQHLEGHELFDIDWLVGRMTYLETVPLCHYCHCFVHDGRLLAALQAQRITREKYNAVIIHGRAVLTTAGLPPARPNYKPFAVADWKDWRMIVGELEFPPKYASYEEWVDQVHWSDE